jgi:hypothetical protein
MQNYKHDWPVARGSEILANRWTPPIVREPILGSHRFSGSSEGGRESPARCRRHVSRGLEDAGVVEQDSIPGESRAVTGQAYGR